MKPKVALVQDWLTGFAGGEQVLLCLHKIFPDAPIFTSIYNPEKVAVFKNAKIITSPLQKIPGSQTHHQICIPLMPSAFETFDLKEFDIIISLGSFAKGVITHPHQKHYNYCHTPIRYLWRLGGDTRTEGWLRNKVTHSMRLWDVVSSSRVDQFIANSQTVSDRISKIYRRDSIVIYPPVNIHKFGDVKRDPKDYYFTLGRMVGYKRVDLIVQTCVDLERPLKVVGTGPEMEKCKQIAQNAPWIEFLGRVPDVELKDMYGYAKAFLFAAEEDFGIAPIEAISAGCPVIAYGRGGATESVIEGLNGIFFQEQTVDSLSEAIIMFESLNLDTEKAKDSVNKFDEKIFNDAILGLIK